MGSSRKICVGMITGAHGVRGLVRLRSFTEEPEDIAGFKKLTDEDGERSFRIEIQNAAKDHFVAAIDGVDSKEAADGLRGLRLYVTRDDLPKTKKREYYAADLVGLAARSDAGKEFGTVLAVHDHGAGSFLEIGTTKKNSFMLPFNDTCVPELDVEGGVAVIAPPDGWLDDVKKPGKGARHG